MISTKSNLLLGHTKGVGYTDDGKEEWTIPLSCENPDEGTAWTAGRLGFTERKTRINKITQHTKLFNIV